jgi:GntR family transcriptional regulator
MQYDSKMPIYVQVIQAIKLDIINERIKSGEKLPSSRDLAVQYTINPNTAARVYQELEREGVCYTKRGMGTFVTEDESKILECKREMAQGCLADFLRQISELGISKEEAIDMINKMD